MPFTREQAKAILAEARANVRSTQRDMRRWRAEEQQQQRCDGDIRRRDGASRFVTKTRVSAKAPDDADADGKLILISAADLYPYLDQRIEKDGRQHSRNCG